MLTIIVYVFNSSVIVCNWYVCFLPSFLHHVTDYKHRFTLDIIIVVALMVAFILVSQAILSSSRGFILHDDLYVMMLKAMVHQWLR